MCVIVCECVCVCACGCACRCACVCAQFQRCEGFVGSILYPFLILTLPRILHKPLKITAQGLSRRFLPWHRATIIRFSHPLVSHNDNDCHSSRISVSMAHRHPTGVLLTLLRGPRKFFHPLPPGLQKGCPEFPSGPSIQWQL